MGRHGHREADSRAGGHGVPNVLPDQAGDPKAGDRGLGFGFTGGVVVSSAHADTSISEGSFSWGGAASTVFWVDPKEELLVMVFTQLMMGQERLDQHIAPLVYQAIID